jgi:hypothetical protein
LQATAFGQADRNAADHGPHTQDRIALERVGAASREPVASQPVEPAPSATDTAAFAVAFEI